MNVYYIVDMLTGDRWSRNRWCGPNAIPDLYISLANAKRQIDSGKIGVYMSLPSNRRKPEILQADLRL